MKTYPVKVGVATKNAVLVEDVEVEFEKLVKTIDYEISRDYVVKDVVEAFALAFPTAFSVVNEPKKGDKIN